MIVVDLIHPIQQKAVQSWTFDESQLVVRIGRSRKNDITLLSGVVSREHAVLRFNGRAWMLNSVGANGCYFDGRPVKNLAMGDGDTFRIARTGPRLRVRIDSSQAVDLGSTQPEAPGARSQVTTSPRSRLNQEEITTARETWVAPIGTPIPLPRRRRIPMR